MTININKSLFTYCSLANFNFPDGKRTRPGPRHFRRISQLRTTEFVCSYYLLIIIFSQIFVFSCETPKGRQDGASTHDGSWADTVFYELTDPIRGDRTSEANPETQDTTSQDISFLDANCGMSVYAHELPGAMLILLDRSGSMRHTPSSSDPLSKWDSTVEAIVTMLNSADDSVQMGILLFPAGDFDYERLTYCRGPHPPEDNEECIRMIGDGGCMDVSTIADVAVNPLSVSRPQIINYLSSQHPEGETPTLWALKRSYQIMQNVETDGQRYVMLMTDGDPDVHLPEIAGYPESFIECGTLEEMEQIVEEAANATPSIHTFVVASTGYFNREFMSQMAINGKTPRSPGCTAEAGNCHYHIGSDHFEEEMVSALETIAGIIKSCTFSLPEPTEGYDPDQVNVAIQTEEGIHEIYADPSHTNGWDYTDSSHTKIKLYGPPCELYKDKPGNSVIIVFGCETVFL